MNTHETIKKMLVGLIIIIAFALGATLVINIFKKDDAPAQTTDELKSPVTKTEVAQDKLPEKFPATLPIEEGAKITQNYNATANDGRYQATRAFETSKTLAENYTLYNNWLKSNGYTISSTVDEDVYKMVSGTKDKQTVQVSVSENTASKTKTVTISLTQLP